MTDHGSTTIEELDPQEVDCVLEPCDPPVEDRDDPLASARLEDMYRADRAWSPLARVLLDRAEACADSDRAAELFCEVASLYRDQLGKPIAARTVLLKAFGKNPRSSKLADALEALAYETGQWIETLEVYQLAARSTSDQALASELHLRVSCAHIVGTGDMHAAHASLEQVTALDPERARHYLDVVEQAAATIAALETIANVCRRIEDWPRLSRTLSRGVAISSDIAGKARFHHLIGEVEHAQGNVVPAEWHLAEALRLDPTRVDSRDILAEIYRKRGEPRRAATLFEEGRAVTLDPVGRAAMARHAAEIYEQDLGEKTCALKLYTQALHADPRHARAAVPLVDKYFDAGRWSELEPIIDMLVENFAAMEAEPSERCELMYKAGQTALQLGKLDKARRHLQATIEAMPMHLAAIRAAARVQQELGSFDAALELLDKALVIQRGACAEAREIADTLYRMGETRRGAGKLQEAGRFYQRALEKSGYRSDIFARLAQIHRERGEYGEVILLVRRYLSDMDDAAAIDCLVDVGGLLSHKLRRGHDAIDVYREVLNRDPGHRYSLQQLVELYSEVGDWEQAVSTILEIVRLESDSYRRGKYYQTAGTISRHHLGVESAIDFHNMALDSFFGDSPSCDQVRPLSPQERTSAMRAFHSLVGFLSERGDWKRLERIYRRMIKRLRPDAPEVAGLWRDLGTLYRERLGQRYSAIGSFEVAAALNQDSLTNHRILIDLYEEAGADQLDKAIERRYRLLRAEPFVPEHYKALRSLFVRARQMDRVWCVCRALEFLGQADPSERAFYRGHLRRDILWPRVPLNAEMWARLRHEDEDPVISRVLGLACEASALEVAVKPRKLNLADDASPHFVPLREFYAGVIRALGLPTFPLHVQPELRGDMFLANVRRGRALEPAFVGGRALYEGQTVQQIVHTMARTLAYGRRSYYLRLALVTEGELRAAFFGAVTTAYPEAPVPDALAKRAARYRAGLMARLHPTWLDKLSVAVHQLLQGSTDPDLARWGFAVDAAARRAGLLLTADLEGAVASISAEPLFATGPSHRDKVRDLLLHSVSPEHFDLREDLALQIETDG